MKEKEEPFGPGGVEGGFGAGRGEGGRGPVPRGRGNRKVV